MQPNYEQAKKRTKEKSEIIREIKIEKLVKNKKYFIKTYGCQMNERDTETIKGILEQIGYIKTENYLKADLILLNTCAIRENAHNKAFGMMGRIKNLKEQRPEVIAGICGCMAQEEGVVEQIKTKYKYIDLVFGTHNIHNLIKILKNVINKKQQEIEVFSKEGDIIEDLPVKRDNKYKAYINIIYGCDKFCTYCIVPYTRGKERSRLKEDILKEVDELIKEGYQEITLLGQNVNAYGKDTNYKMEDLLNDISKKPIKRVKFLTSHPWDFTDEMIQAIKNSENILPFIHLPVQSGSNKILKLMGRKYTKESYIKLFNKIKKEIPNSAITTDIIVGFPNETDEDFKETLDLVNECKFDAAFTFIYSKREKTPAANMKDDVSLETKEKRLKELNIIINNYSSISNKKLINKKVSVLLEGKSSKENMLFGYTQTNKLINVKADEKYIGKVVDVLVEETKTWSLYGKIL